MRASRRGKGGSRKDPEPLTSSAAGVSPGRFAWLFGPAGPPSSGLPDAEEFRAACEFALDAWQVLPVVLPKLLDWGGPENAESAGALAVRDRTVSLTVLAEVQLLLLRRFAADLDRGGIPYALLKGSAIRFTAYPRPQLRCGKDIDIGVPRHLLRKAQRVAERNGFIPSEWSYTRKRFSLADPVLRAAVEARHYELGFLARRQVIRNLRPEQEEAIRRDLPSQVIWHLTDRGELACYVSLDIHHGLSLDISTESLLETARTWTGDGGTLRVPAPEWTLLHLLYKIYWEGVHNYRKGGYQYADLARAVAGLAEADFQKLAGLLVHHRLEAAGHYVLRRLETDLGMQLSPSQAAFVSAHAQAPMGVEPFAVNDLGDMWPKLWGHR